MRVWRDCNCRWDPTLYSSGTHQLRVKVEDAAGNVKIVSSDFSLDEQWSVDFDLAATLILLTDFCSLVSMKISVPFKNISHWANVCFSEHAMAQPCTHTSSEGLSDKSVMRYVCDIKFGSCRNARLSLLHKWSGGTAQLHTSDEALMKTLWRGKELQMACGNTASFVLPDFWLQVDKHKQWSKFFSLVIFNVCNCWRGIATMHCSSVMALVLAPQGTVQDVFTLYNWSKLWNRNFNPPKTAVMTISNQRNVHTCFNKTHLSETDTRKHLCLLFHHSLSWHAHILHLYQKVVTKVNRFNLVVSRHQEYK